MSDPHSAAAGSAMHDWLACGIFVAAFAVIVSEKVHKTKVALFGAGLVLAPGIVSQAGAFHSPHLASTFRPSSPTSRTCRPWLRSYS